MTPALPRAARPIAGFPAFLRGFGFAASGEQTVAFMAAVTVLGPRGMADIRRAAHATLAPPPERHDEFDALFRAFFHGEAATTQAADAPGEETVAKDDGRERHEPPEAAGQSESGRATTGAEILGSRAFPATEPDEALRRLIRRTPDVLPRRRAFRRQRAKAGRTIDIRRTLRAALATEGDLPALKRLKPRTRQRNVLILIDVSGSMKAHTADYLRVAHAVTRAADRAETFTFGTRLTRITRAMRLRDRDRALAEASAIVEDWDGGTRIGDALTAFLAIPRFAAHARGGLVIVLSDGLERGDHRAMVEAVRRLSRLSWRLAWLTPLAADPRFRPRTAALKAILPWLDDLGDGGSVAAVARYILNECREGGRWSAAGWREGEGRAA